MFLKISTSCEYIGRLIKQYIFYKQTYIHIGILVYDKRSQHFKAVGCDGLLKSDNISRCGYFICRAQCKVKYQVSYSKTEFEMVKWKQQSVKISTGPSKRGLCVIAQIVHP